jgi:hypothetical protein
VDASKPVDTSKPVDASRPVDSAGRARRAGRDSGSAAERGYLTIVSQPYATLSLEGHSLGVTPIWRLALAPGSYRIDAAAPDGRHHELSVTIRAGHDTRKKVDWGTR